ncbi:MAG: peptidoglycan DD-metalloendopeptidase family protein [Nocardioidaceae bacterium]
MRYGRHAASPDYFPDEVISVVHTARRARVNRRRCGVAMTLVASCLASLMVPSAGMAIRQDDELRHRKSSVESRIDRSRGDIDEISGQLMRAQRLVDKAEADLVAAQSYLAGLHEQVEQAEVFDQHMQAKLETALIRLADARLDLQQSQVDAAKQRADLAGYAVSNFQAGGIGLSSLEVAFDSQTAQDAVDSFQDVDTVVNKESVALQELQATEVLLALTEERVEQTKSEVKRNRLLAADNLDNKRTLEAQAAEAERQVAAQVEELQIRQRRVEAAKRVELRRLAALEGERKRIEAVLRAIAERRARHNHTTLTAKPPAPPATVKHGGARDVGATSDDGGLLGYPVTDTYVTSSYGMRLHPILQVYKLHDGTDFHADCGSPVYAAADGRVTEAYYNSGYGNRIILDHGYVAGVSLATSYNHLTSFVAQPGELVKKGDVVAYAGTTGYSTACHLHFMVYVNGSTVDPVTWL